jgi:signal transduction histidine kinase
MVQVPENSTTQEALSAYIGGLSEADLREMVIRLAHEVRNPLASIKAGVQLIQHLTHPERDVARHFASVLVQVGRIDLTVQGMQRFVRLAEPSPSTVGIDEAVRDCVEAQAEHAHDGGARATIVGGPEFRLRVDPAHFRAALSEVLSNAFRFSPPGAAVLISWVRQGNDIVLSVDDEGPGIPKENAERILRPFFSTSTQGTGLGLNIADKVCRLAGGRLVWRNHPDRGCRFSLQLPEA